YKAKAQKEAGEKIELLRGFNKHRTSKFLNLLNKAKKEILIANKLPDRISKKASDEADEFLDNGGKLRTIYQIGETVRVRYDEGWREVNKKELIELLKSYETDSAEIRLTDNLPQSFFVFDERYVFLNIVDESVDQFNKSDLIIDNEKYATAMKDLFDYYWDNSMTISEFEKSENEKNQ
ncbi:MAG TPA: hypothetical protein VK004_01180, partial [Ignavibacteria bacterium]|nr:hypothetical protein [Ignavibacteria bacterium]